MIIIIIIIKIIIINWYFSEYKSYVNVISYYNVHIMNV